ncbi:EAL domain-containing protein [Pontixanthobacter sp.]|uniref:EAL domain-containing protein n=1 Tax=Pontixanthobacter sp. TaxID=2792078 RepID=UPI003C7B3D15
MRAFELLRSLIKGNTQPEHAGRLPSRGREVSGARQRKIALVVTAILTLVIGLIELPLPAEDAYRAVRAELREKAPPQDIVLVEIDDRTLRELGLSEPKRAQNADLIDILFANGAKSIVFDRAYADPSDIADDMIFADALARHGSKVRLGAAPPIDNGLQQHDALIPNSNLRPHANLASMVGKSSPLSLSVSFPTETAIWDQNIPSISSFLADYDGPAIVYRPDFAFDVEQIPTTSFIDILNYRMSRTDIAGKSFIITDTYLGSDDFKSLPFGKRISGAYFHVLGAHTLSERRPIDLGWGPTACLILLLIGIQSGRRKPSRQAFWATMLFVVVLPLPLDSAGINIDIMPGVLGMLIGYGLLGRVSRKHFSDDTSYLRVSALLTQSNGLKEKDIFALKMRNLNSLCSSLAPLKSNEIIEFVADRIEASEDTSRLAFENNTIIWLKPKVGPDEIADHLMGIQAIFQSGILIKGQSVNFSVAVGCDTNHDISANDRIQNAIQCAEDAAETQSAVKVADSHYLSARNEQTELLSDLDRAIEQHTIVLGYQPKVMIANGAIFGAEALLRWTHSDFGKVPAQKIIRLAEQHGRIAKLTECVLEIALGEACAAIELNPYFKLSVNISAKSLSDDTFVSKLKAQLRRSGFPAGNLMLEITETAPLDASRAAETLSQLHSMNVELSIDDFGTGQSNLDYLRRIPSSEIKIDRQFVTNMNQSADDKAVVIATINLAAALNRTVIAEGVETKEVADMLASLGCKRAQGFLYSGAIPIRELLGKIYRGRIAA